MWFLFFRLLLGLSHWLIWMFKNPCIPGINLTWSWCIIFLMYCWIWFGWRLLCLCSSVILVCNFLSCGDFGFDIIWILVTSQNEFRNVPFSADKIFPGICTTNVLVPTVSHSHPLASPWAPPRPAHRSGPGSYEVTAFCPGIWCIWHLVYALQEWSLVPSVLWMLGRADCRTSKAKCSESPFPDARFPGWGIWHAAQNSHSFGRTSAI